LRGLVYLKRIAESLARIADVAEYQSGMPPKRRSRGEPRTEVFTPSVADWNARHREEHPEIDLQGYSEE
jgi:hypothetical protein